MITNVNFIYLHVFFHRILFLSRFNAISRMGMDGSNFIDILTDVIKPEGLTVDLYSDRIWWSDYNNQIE